MSKSASSAETSGNSSSATPADLDPWPDDRVRAVEFLAEVFEARSIRYALIGELAFMLRGRLEFTNQGVDFLIDVPQIAMPRLLDDLIQRGVTLDPAVIVKEYAQEYMTSLPFRGVRIGWLKPVLALYSRALADAAPVEWTGGRSIRVATPEGLILTKIVAFRPQDQLDIDTLLTANRDTIDVDLIRREWAPFAHGEPERTAWLETAIDKKVVRRE